LRLIGTFDRLAGVLSLYVVCYTPPRRQPLSPLWRSSLFRKKKNDFPQLEVRAFFLNAHALPRKRSFFFLISRGGGVMRVPSSRPPVWGPNREGFLFRRPGPPLFRGGANSNGAGPSRSALRHPSLFFFFPPLNDRTAGFYKDSLQRPSTNQRSDQATILFSFFVRGESDPFAFFFFGKSGSW